MAGEYSRELSAKVFHRRVRLIKLGFRQGGTAGFGLRRILSDLMRRDQRPVENGRTQESSNGPRGIRSRAGRRGQIVRWIYHEFMKKG